LRLNDESSLSYGTVPGTLKVVRTGTVERSRLPVESVPGKHKYARCQTRRNSSLPYTGTYKNASFESFTCSSTTKHNKLLVST
jgi:hypothetical protein